MSWKSAENILDNIIAAADPKLKDSIEKAWSSLEESSYADIVTFKDGELLLKVKNSAYLQILNMKKYEIMRDINKTIKEDIRNIRFSLGG